MNILRLVVVGLFISILIACGSESGNDSSSENGNDTEKKQGAIPEHQLKALDKAKNTENILLESEQKRKKEMEEQGL
jgi:hypothetical protein